MIRLFTRYQTVSALLYALCDRSNRRERVHASFEHRAYTHPFQLPATSGASATQQTGSTTMSSRKSTTTTCRTVAAAIGLAILGTAAASTASAGCGAPDNANLVPTVWHSQAPAQGQARLMPAMFIRTGYEASEDASIVGLWKTTFTSKGNSFVPDGVVLDEGFAAWHSDGTEIMNSGRPPISGSFCMGAWKQIGPSTFKLNHWGLSWDANGGTTFQGPANIRETVTVFNDGRSYAGTFTIVNYATDGVTVLPPGVIKGTVSASRVTAD
jgi:hypothetical protein